MTDGERVPAACPGLLDSQERRAGDPFLSDTVAGRNREEDPMLRRIRSRLTYSNVVASMALFVALGGASYAAVKLPKNSVGGAQIKKNAVSGAKVRNDSLGGWDVRNGTLRGGDVKNGSLTGADVKDGSLTAKDLRGSVQGAQGARGPQGPIGESGPKGDAGVKGDTGPPGPTYAEVEDRENPAGNPDTVLVEPDPTTITTPTSGRLLVMFTTDAFQASCTSGISTLGLYVDGIPVPDTLREFPVGVPARPVSVFGVTATAVPAGAHILTVGRDCPTGDPIGSAVGQNNNLGAILLGE